MSTVIMTICFAEFPESSSDAIKKFQFKSEFHIYALCNAHYILVVGP